MSLTSAYTTQSKFKFDNPKPDAIKARATKVSLSIIILNGHNIFTYIIIRTCAL